MKVGDRVEVTRTSLATRGVYKLGTHAFDTGASWVCINQWVTLMMISQRTRKKSCIRNHFGEGKCGL